MADKKKTVMEPAAPAVDRKRAPGTVMARIKKAYSKGSIIRLDDSTDIVVETIPTSSLSLDLTLGIGGVSRGHVIEIYDPELSGRVTLAPHIVVEAQKRGGEVAFIDAEHTLNPYHARALGVDIDSMLISQSDTGEQGLKIYETLVRSDAIDMVVVDSTTTFTPRAEIEDSVGDSHVGLLTRLTSQTLCKLAGSIAKANCVVIFINQLREEIGVMYGNPGVTTGGRMLKLYASVRVNVRHIESLKNDSGIIDNRTRTKMVKDRVSPPFKEAEFDIMYGEGISKIGEVLDLGTKLDLVQKSGSWFAVGGTHLSQSRDMTRQYLKGNSEVCDRLEADVRRDACKLMSSQTRAAARTADRVVNISVENFEDVDS